MDDNRSLKTVDLLMNIGTVTMLCVVVPVLLVLAITAGVETTRSTNEIRSVITYTNMVLGIAAFGTLAISNLVRQKATNRLKNITGVESENEEEK